MELAPFEDSSRLIERLRDPKNKTDALVDQRKQTRVLFCRNIERQCAKFFS
jgi:hypothetical protein